VVARVIDLSGQGVEADLAPTALAGGQIAHHAGQDDAALVIGQALGHAVAHGSHQGVGGAQVNAHGDAPLVRVGRLAGFGNLQQCHGRDAGDAAPVGIGINGYCPC